MTTSANANNGERSNENPFDKLTEQETKMSEQLTRIDVDPHHANEMAPKLVAQGLIDLQRVKYFFKDCDQKQFYEKVQGRKYGMKDWSAMKLWDHLQTMTESKTDGQDESKTDGQDESKTDGQDESKTDEPCALTWTQKRKAFCKAYEAKDEIRSEREAALRHRRAGINCHWKETYKYANKCYPGLVQNKEDERKLWGMLRRTLKKML